MSAAVSYPRVPASSLDLAVVIPAELAALFEESNKAKSTYYRMEERDRRGFNKFIDLAMTTVARERRAAIVATSLLGLAACFSDETRS